MSGHDKYLDKLLNEDMAKVDRQFNIQIAEEKESDRLDDLLASITIECPHCHKGPDLKFESDMGSIFVVCGHCGSSTGFCDTHEQAVALWEGRTL